MTLWLIAVSGEIVVNFKNNFSISTRLVRVMGIKDQFFFGTAFKTRHIKTTNNPTS